MSHLNVDGPSKTPIPREPPQPQRQEPSSGPGQSWARTRAATGRVHPQSAALLATQHKSPNQNMNHTKTKLRLTSKSRCLGISHLRPRPFIKGVNGSIQNLQLGRRSQPEPWFYFHEAARK